MHPSSVKGRLPLQPHRLTGQVGMLDSLDAEYGPVDEALVAKYTELL
jgi:hypothetical protein